ncbi:MAG: DoxX family protein [Planctomycetes bacterium]|nr:DoxX family protein [Planctomycetota bacterium]
MTDQPTPSRRSPPSGAAPLAGSGVAAAARAAHGPGSAAPACTATSPERLGCRLHRLLFGTGSHWSGLFLRLALAVVMFPHGAQKVLGWWGGYGFDGTMGFLTGTVGLPWIVALLVIAIEFLGPIALAIGALTRLAALGMVAVMVGAIATVHASHGFFMNWSGAQQGEGFEYHLLVIGIALALLTGGAGRFSLDHRFARGRAA